MRPSFAILMGARGAFVSSDGSVPPTPRSNNYVFRVADTIAGMAMTTTPGKCTNPP
jgi:hypothetical protein